MKPDANVEWKPVMAKSSALKSRVASAETVTAVRLSRNIVEAARAEGALQSRSIGGQIEHWVRLGMAIEMREGADKRLLDRLLAGEVIGDGPEHRESAFRRAWSGAASPWEAKR